MTRELNGSQFKEEVLNSKSTVMVDFSATWCGPCKMLAPVIDELSAELAGKAEVFKVDVDKSSDLAQQYGIMGVPTVMIFKNGTVVDKMVGFQPKGALKSKLEQYTNEH